MAPSIWQLDDVKKGILCQLFGGVSKVRRWEGLQQLVVVVGWWRLLRVAAAGGCEGR